MKYFIDTNILIDLVTLREPFGKAAVLFFESARAESWELFSSALSIATTHYIVQKQNSPKVSNAIIGNLLDLLEIVPANGAMLRKAVSHPITDFEDALQFECAISIKGINGIITRNRKDFKHSTIPVFAPEEVLL